MQISQNLMKLLNIQMESWQLRARMQPHTTLATQHIHTSVGKSPAIQQHIKTTLNPNPHHLITSISAHNVAINLKGCMVRCHNRGIYAWYIWNMCAQYTLGKGGT